MMNQWSRSDTTRSYFYAALIIMCGFYLIFSSPLIDHNSGVGWDGVSYHRMVEHLVVDFFSIPARLSRSLPSFFVAGAIKISGAPVTTEVIVFLFKILNLTFFAASFLILIRIAKSLNFSIYWAFSLAITYMISFSSFSYIAFYPVQTDSICSLMTLLVLLFWINSNRKGIIITTLISIIVNPIVVGLGLIFLLFPRNKIASQETIIAHTKEKYISAFAAAVAGLAVGALALEIWLIRGPDNGYFDIFPMKTAYIIFGIPVMMLILAAMAYHPILYIITLLRKNSIVDIARIHEKFCVKFYYYPIIAIMVFSLCTSLMMVMKHYLVDNFYWGQHLRFFMFSWIYNGSAIPFRATVAHIVFSGPVFALLLLLWVPVNRQAARLGICMPLLLLMLAGLAVNSESRHFLSVTLILGILPFMILAERAPQARLAPALLAVASIIMSRPWWGFNPDMPKAGQWENLLVYPAQEYFSFFGPWMTPHAVLIQLPWVAFTVIMCIIAIRAARR